MKRRLFIAAVASAAVLPFAASAPSLDFGKIAPRDPAVRLARDVAYGEGPRRRLDVYAPKDARPGLPVVVFFYGGGWRGGRRQDYVWAGDALASRGFLAIVPDYRLAPATLYPGFVEDAAAVVRWIQDNAARYGGDPNRIFLMGHSAGAYLAAQVVLDDDFLKAAGADLKRIRGVVGLAGPYDFYPYPDEDARVSFSGATDPRATQPITYAARPNRPPFLLLQGAEDTDVGPKAPLTLHRALQAAGNRSTLKIYPGLTHPGIVLALSMPFRDRAPVLDDSVRFMKAAAGR
jgi:acetyl esterase/lipase